MSTAFRHEREGEGRGEQQNTWKNEDKRKHTRETLIAGGLGVCRSSSNAWALFSSFVDESNDVPSATSASNTQSTKSPKEEETLHLSIIVMPRRDRTKRVCRITSDEYVRVWGMF